MLICTPKGERPFDVTSKSEVVRMTLAEWDCSKPYLPRWVNACSISWRNSYSTGSGTAGPGSPFWPPGNIPRIILQIIYIYHQLWDKDFYSFDFMGYCTLHFVYICRVSWIKEFIEVLAKKMFTLRLKKCRKCRIIPYRYVIQISIEISRSSLFNEIFWKHKIWLRYNFSLPTVNKLFW